MKNSRSLLEKSVRQKIEKILKDRSDARNDVLAFTQYTMHGYEVGRHHRLLADKLNAVERGEIKRLMVCMPPRNGKSELTSVRFPAWYLGKHPDRQAITASYSADLAENTFGRRVRNLFREDEFKHVFPSVMLSSDSQAKGQWATNKGGVYTAAGVDGGLTGKGADIAIIDDPHKDRKEAESQVVRESVWDWYRSVLYTRLMPGASIVLVLTRWHPDDLAGRLLNAAKNGGDQWEVFELPAIADSSDDALGRSIGEPLWPERYPLPVLKQIRDVIGPRDWSALYQQQPTEAEGNLFKVAQVKVVDSAPAKPSAIVRSWDLAATSDNGSNDPDWTVGVKMARYPDNTYCILDVIRLRGDPLAVRQAIFNTASQDGRSVKIRLPQDPGQAGKAQSQEMTGQLSGYSVEVVRETGDKSTRAAPFSAQVNAGNVSIVKAPWNSAFLEEHKGFPAVKHDDQVDASAGAFNKLVITNSMPDLSAFARGLPPTRY